MIKKNKNHGKNEERTAKYLETFSREKTIKLLINREDPVIFDVGANNGSSLDEFKEWWPQSHVHCFEPQDECMEELNESAHKHSNAGNVYINHMAAGNKSNESAQFYTHDINTGVSGFNKINMNSRDSLDLEKLSEEDDEKKLEYGKTLNHAREVSLMRLDDYIDNHDVLINSINLLKIDTQGFEPEVLEGFGDKLELVDVVLTELMFYDFYERSLSFSDIEKYLLKANFQLYDISHIAKNPMNGRTDWVDVVYVNKRLLKK
jgi:FkbM family methyltransferase